MTDSGPTTAGSIIARLKMDRDQWVRDVEETKLDAREIGSLDPTIKVKADTSTAMAQIEALRIAAENAGVAPSNTGAVSAATSIAPSVSTGPSAAAVAAADKVTAAQLRLTNAERAAANAASTAYIANERLAAMEGKRGVTELQLAAATEAVARADRNAEGAELRQMAATEALALVQKKAAAVALEEAAANEAGTKAKDKANNSNGTTITRMGMIVTAVAALVAMGAPLVGFAVGGAGALTMMGAAGILAILGIKNQMTQGTAAGNTFSAGLQILKGNLSALAATASTAMLGPFQIALSMINANMPALNSQIGLFSKQLGIVGNSALSGVLSGLRVLNPLFLTAGVYVEQLAVGFQKWTQDGGLQKFAQMAMGSLPAVIHTLGSLADGAVHLIGALAPLGTVLLGALTIIGQLATFLTVVLGPAFSPVVAGVLLVVGGFKLWGAIAPVVETVTTSVTKFGVATMTSLGVVGLIVAALGYLAAAYIGSKDATNQATQAQQNYTAAVEQDNGVVGKNVQAQAAKSLSDAGALTAAQKLSIATRTLTDATSGGADAQQKLAKDIAAANVKLDASQKALTQSSTASAGATREYNANWKALKTLTDAYDQNKTGIKDAIKAYNDVAAAQGLTSISTKAQLQAVTDLAKGYGMSVPEYMSAKAAQKQTADQLAITTRNMYYQNDAGGLLKQTLDKLNGVAITAASAQNQFDSSLANSNTHIDATGKTINRATVSLDGMSAAAVANRGELIGQVTAAQTAGEAYRNMTDANGKLINSTEDGRQKLIDMKKQIVDNAVAHGEDRAAVQKFVDTLYTIPASVPTVHVEADTAAAQAKIDAILKSLSILSQNTVVAGRGATYTGHADSATITGHADGATVTGPGTSTSDSVLRRLSVGEEVTKASRASVFRPMLKAINNGSPAQIAAAAANLAGPSTSNAGPSIVNHWNISQADISGAITEIQRRQQGKSA